MLTPTAPLSQFTTTTSDVPPYGYLAVCAAETACPHVAIGTTPAEAQHLIEDHEHHVHGVTPARG